MAKRPLKVFRTSAGFQDAYVATTSRKAALEAWGARTNLFASGIAELVTDPALAKAALDQPGKVVRVARGTTAQHLAAAGKKRKPEPRPEREAADGKASPPPEPLQRKPKPRPVPKPSRAKLDKAEVELEKRRNAFASEIAQIEKRMADLRHERDAVRAEMTDKMAKLEERRRCEEEVYRSELGDWEG